MVNKKALVPLVMSACLMGCAEETTSMLLDSVCAQDVSTISGQSSPGCVLEGDAEFTTGISGDSTAVIFGPNGGTLRIRINAIPASAQSTWSLDVLTASSRPEANTVGRSLTWGSCGAPCPADPADAEAPLSESYQWVTVVDSALGSNFSTPPDDASVVLRGQSIHIIDVRTPGFEQLVEQL